MEVSASCSGRFTSGERAPDIHWIGGLVDPRAVLDAVAKRKISHHCPCHESNPGHLARRLVTILTERRAYCISHSGMKENLKEHVAEMNCRREMSIAGK
jgi:hypothetical protein